LIPLEIIRQSTQSLKRNNLKLKKAEKKTLFYATLNSFKTESAHLSASTDACFGFFWKGFMPSLKSSKTVLLETEKTT